MSLVCKIKIGKRVHNHTHPSSNSHSFISDAVAKTKQTTQLHYIFHVFYKRARRTAAGGCNLSPSALGLSEPWVITSCSSLLHYRDFEVHCCTVQNSAILIKTIPSNWSKNDGICLFISTVNLFELLTCLFANVIRRLSSGNSDVDS